MTRVESILVRVRDSLADPDGRKWSTEHLLRLLDEGQKDLCRKAKLLRTEIDMTVLGGVQEYKLPSDFLLLDSVLYNGRALDFCGHSEIESKDKFWAKREGEPTAVIYDKQMAGSFKLYPRPLVDPQILAQVVPSIIMRDNERIKEDFGVLSFVEPPSEFKQDFGVCVSITGFWTVQEDVDTPSLHVVEGKLDSDFGVVVRSILAHPLEVLSSDEGAITALNGVASDTPFGVMTALVVEDVPLVKFTDTYGLGRAFRLEEHLQSETYFQSEGIVSDICGLTSQDFGIFSYVSMFQDMEVIIEDDFGHPTGLFGAENSLKVYYLRRPVPITSVESELEVDSNFDDALKYFVAGKALIDAIDAQNRSLGESFLVRYEELSNLAQNFDSKDFTRSGKVWFSDYYGGF